MGERRRDALRVNFDRKLKIEFQGKHSRIVVFISQLDYFYKIERLSGIPKRSKW